MKLDRTKVAAVLGHVPGLIRRQQATIEEQREKLAHYEQQERCEKIAKALEGKGLMAEFSLEEKVAQLVDKTSSELDTISAAVDMSTPHMGLGKLAGGEEEVTGFQADPNKAEAAFIDNVLSM